MSRIEQTIINNLLHNEDFTRKTLPFIKKEYFLDIKEFIVVEEIQKFFDKYNTLPNKEVIAVQISNRKDLTESEYKEAISLIENVSQESVNQSWLINETENFCKKKALHNSILECISIMDGRDKTRNVDALPKILQDALSVSFDTNIGHNYLEDAEARWEYYHAKDENRIPFDIEILNIITNGGLKKKTLNVFGAPTGVGKTILGCHVAGSSLRQGFNVLYLTMEMGEEEISERVDANMMNITMDDVGTISKDTFLNKIEKIKSKTNGKLIVKEFPTNVHAGHFRALIEELKQKQEFIPDLLIVDYLGICGSQRLRHSGSVNTNTLLKSVSEEMRDLGKYYDIPVLSFVQFNREGQENTDVDITNIAESIGITNTLDLFVAIMAPEELVNLNQYLFKQLKNRYRDVNYFKRFVVGIDKSRMKFYDVEQAAQEKISDRGITQPQTDPERKGFDDFQF